MPPDEIRTRLDLLELERRAAHSAGLTECPEYMTDLDDEVAECRAALTAAMVIEIALERATRSGPLHG